MKKLTTLLCSMAFLAISFQTIAQDLPKPSPKSKIEQRIGLTDFTMDYSRPSVKGREIWGSLVPYDKIWRTGANENSLFTCSTPVKVNGETLPAGTYAYLILPYAKGEWIVVMNTKTDMWGTDGYDEKNNAIRVSVKPLEGRKLETMTFSFDNISDDKGELTFEWAGKKVVLNLEVDVKEQALANIETAIKDNPKNARVYRNAAGYMHGIGEHKKALDYINMSLDIDDTQWYPNWMKAEILYDLGRVDEAKAQGQVALEVGLKQAKESGKPFTYEEMINEEMAKW